MIPFYAGNTESQRLGLASLLPNDPLFAAKNDPDTNTYSFLKALANEFLRQDMTIYDIGQDLQLPITVDLITNWEEMVGIPNEIFGITKNNLGVVALTLEDRIGQVILQFRAMGALTAQDFITLGALIGTPITITYPTNDPWTDITWQINGENLIGNNPPYNVPFTPGPGAQQVIDFFTLLNPEGIILLFANT